MARDYLTKEMCLTCLSMQYVEDCHCVGKRGPKIQVRGLNSFGRHKRTLFIG